MTLRYHAYFLKSNAEAFSVSLPLPAGQLVVTFRIVPSPVDPPAPPDVDPPRSDDREAVVLRQRANEEGDK